MCKSIFYNEKYKKNAQNKIVVLGILFKGENPNLTVIGIEISDMQREKKSNRENLIVTGMGLANRQRKRIEGQSDPK